MVQSNSFHSNNTEVANLAIPVIVLKKKKKPIPSRNSLCFKSMTPVQYISATLCAHQSTRLWAAVLGHLTLCPFKERAVGQSSEAFYSLGRGEICTPYPTETIFVIRCFRVWSQCIDIWMEFCPSFLSILKIPMKLLPYGFCFSEKAVPSQSCSWPHAATRTLLHSSSFLWLHPSLPSTAPLPYAGNGTCVHPGPHCCFLPAVILFLPTLLRETSWSSLRFLHWLLTLEICCSCSIDITFTKISTDTLALKPLESSASQQHFAVLTSPCWLEWFASFGFQATMWLPSQLPNSSFSRYCSSSKPPK